MKAVSCPSCAAVLPEDSRFCPRCGSSVEAPPLRADGPTRTVLDHSPGPASMSPRRTDVTSAGRLAVSESGVATRFVAGQVLLERYRILGLIGRGGMGEVYRADDLKLDQPVALKFLPPAFSQDRGRLDRFFSEVRIARQVSHPNVARVYDVGEIEGQTFLSMEYIDGEDLTTLLRRIGRFPGDRAVQIAREICAGLAAAHDRGVLHRDLKPANVMIDGRGRARITDFGLASVMSEQTPADIRSGTPHYMAPEQLEGREVSVRSDLYALGLVLYEIFTGRRAREAGSLAELMRLQASTPVNPSSFVADLDPLVERAILQCLEPDPEERPISALAVAAALPGGDPLAAALAAGEMPSPEAVAAAGGAGVLRAPWALACVAFVLAGIALCAALAPKASLVGRLGVAKSPDVLVDRARQIAETLGHSTAAMDRAWRYSTNADVLEWVNDDKATDRLDLLRPGGAPILGFWYRESPARLNPGGVGNVVTSEDPPPLLGGMLTVRMDTSGHLRGFLSVPKRVTADSPQETSAPPWDLAIQAAGLTPGRLKAVAPQWTPPVYADARQAWEGTWPGTKVPLRIEAAAYRGKIVWLSTIGPWAKPDIAEVGQPKGMQRVALVINVFLVVSALSTACWFAYRNVREGRGDRRGAMRVAGWSAGASALAIFLQANHAADVVAEWDTVVQAISFGMFFGGIVWVLYLALEPFVRRRAPEFLIGWSRLLAGRWRDPRVGRDLLVGAVAGVAILAALSLSFPLAEAVRQAPPRPYENSLSALLGARFVLVSVLGTIRGALASSLLLLLFFSLGLFGFKSPWPGRLIFFSISTTMTFLFRGSGSPVVGLLFAVFASAVLTAVYARFGVLAAFGMQLFGQWSLPLTLDLNAWYAPGMLFALALLLAVPMFGAWTATGGALRRVGI